MRGLCWGGAPAGDGTSVTSPALIRGSGFLLGVLPPKANKYCPGPSADRTSPRSRRRGGSTCCRSPNPNTPTPRNSRHADPSSETPPPAPTRSPVAPRALIPAAPRRDYHRARKLPHRSIQPFAPPAPPIVLGGALSLTSPPARRLLAEVVVLHDVMGEADREPPPAPARSRLGSPPLPSRLPGPLRA